MGFMLKEFIDFVDSVLPSVDPDFRDGAKTAVEQFEKEGHELDFLMSNILDELSQGDIISKVPFVYFDSDGKQKVFVADAMVISTSCHIDQKDKLILAPIIPLTEFKGNQAALNALKKNTIFDFWYIPDAKLNNGFISFSILSTYDKKLLFEGMEKGRIQRIASLNKLGYYFFIIKLSVYFMRKEDAQTLSDRGIGYAS